MLYVQFFQRSATNPNDLVEACGDRSVIILDAQERADTHKTIATRECMRRGYRAWQLWKGDSFTRSTAVSPVYHTP